ncbi:MAG TPA: ribosome biogenesis GTPase Der [Rectinemataceae bacterium]|nr:ribosome biogenesis GTPase Der [Rectinemataceae bacterium]
MKSQPSPSPDARPGDETPEPTRRVRYENLPLVVIVGRPNVGKSTLFNRLLHKRRAITDPSPGVTRDPVDAVWELRSVDKRARLMDTGGFRLDREGLDSLVVEKTLESLERADLVLFVVDASQISPEDEEFASLLRRWTDKLLLVVNKADSPERDSLVWSHARWGFRPVLQISAEHGRNIGELEAEIAARLDFSAVVEVDEDRAPIRLAIMGKPNTGKSTLVNRVLDEEKSIVSEVAGTTRDVIEGRFTYKGRQITVLDTAGIRRKKKVTEAVEYYSVNRAIHTVDEADVVILMIDAREGLTDQDKKIAAFAAEKGRGLIFALNKWDEMPDVKNSFEAARDKLRYFFGQMAWAPVLALSAKEGTGVNKVLDAVITLHAQLNKRIETGRLNRAIEEWIEATPPPVGPRTKFKLRYAVQTGVNPQAFTIFVTRPEAVAESYVSFLRNKLRAELGIDKIPVLVELKESHVRRGAKGPNAAAPTRRSALSPSSPDGRARPQSRSVPRGSKTAAPRSRGTSSRSSPRGAHSSRKPRGAR